MKSRLLKNTVAVTLGIALAAGIVASVEWSFRWWVHPVPTTGPFFPGEKVPYDLGWVPPKNGSYQDRYIFRGKELWDTTYTYDEFHRRVTPTNGSERATQFVLFFGGSNTFGSGLREDETIPALIQRAAPHHRVYNYAYKGYGPHHMLARVQTETLPDEVIEPSGLIFYQYWDFHVDRALGSLSVVRWAGGQDPYYFLDDGNELRRNGSFASGRFYTTLLFSSLAHSAVLDYYRVNIPPQPSAMDYELACRIIEESQRVLLDQFPGSRFVAVVGLTSSTSDPLVQSCFASGRVEYVDLRPYSQGQSGLSRDDSHLSPRGARLTAEHLLPYVH